MAAVRDMPPPSPPAAAGWFVLLAAVMLGCGVQALRAWQRAIDAGRVAVAASAAGGDAEASARAAMLPDILIDPGHGGSDPGTIGAGEHYEKRWALSVSLALAEELRSRGWPVSLTREDDRTIPLPERSVLANQRPRLAVVSVHFNAGGPDASGVEIYFTWPKQPEVMARLEASAGGWEGGVVPQDDGSGAMARSIQAAVCAATGARDRGVRERADLSVTGRSQAPAVLVECGFLTHEQESRDIRSSAWRRRLVRGLADGLCAWLESRGLRPAGSGEVPPGD